VAGATPRKLAVASAWRRCASYRTHFLEGSCGGGGDSYNQLSECGKIAHTSDFRSLFEGIQPKEYKGGLDGRPGWLAKTPLAAMSASHANSNQLILGEATRTIDSRFRVSLPPEMASLLAAAKGNCILAKERPGCLSLWNAATWQTRLEEGLQLVLSKILARRLDTRLDEVQRLGRLLSTRHRQVQLAGRGRLVVPDGFREFLGVDAGGTAMVIGAAVCVEIWQPEKWQTYVGDEMPEFRKLLDTLAG
jgi:transcriptional regulator MraZ